MTSIRGEIVSGELTIDMTRKKGLIVSRYNEPDLLQQVEARLKSQVTELTPPDFKLPPELANTSYGDSAAADEGYMHDIKEHMSMLSADVIRLVELEVLIPVPQRRSHCS